MTDVRVWGIGKVVKQPAYNQQVRVQGIDPGLKDSLDVELWETSEDTAVDPETDYWNSWFVTEAERDDLVTLMESLGPANEPGPSNQFSYYQSDEPQTGASQTTAPDGGWTNQKILADLTRKPNQHKASDVGPVPHIEEEK